MLTLPIMVYIIKTIQKYNLYSIIFQTIYFIGVSIDGFHTISLRMQTPEFSFCDTLRMHFDV